MPNFKLTYFDFNGGRGEPIRIAFHAGGIDFADHRISFEEFMKTRGDMRFSCTPLLEIDGVTVTQSNSMLRYVGTMAGLYPEDDLQALYLERAGGEYFADNRLTVADLKVYVQIRSLRAGTLDHVPTDLVDRLAPSLVQHEERVGKEPIVTAYYAARAS